MGHTDLIRRVVPSYLPGLPEGYVGRPVTDVQAMSHLGPRGPHGGFFVTDDAIYSESGRARSPYLAVGSEIGAYRIEAFIDRGGMAFVYEAIDLRLNRHVAFKVLAPELAKGSDFRQRFLRESHFAASIDHPNIIPIYEAGEVDGLLYIAMRLVRGNTLDGLISEHGALDLEHALAILSPVADALDTAHAAGLVHREREAG